MRAGSVQREHVSSASSIAGAGAVEVAGVHRLVGGVLEQRLADAANPEQHERAESGRAGREPFTDDPLKRRMLR